jgi:hypothetical protein
MKQTDIDRIVEIDRVAWPELHKRAKELRSAKEKLDKEKIDLHKRLLSALKGEQQKIWRTTAGVLVEARGGRENCVTVLDMTEANDEKS